MWQLSAAAAARSKVIALTTHVAQSTYLWVMGCQVEIRDMYIRLWLQQPETYPPSACTCHMQLQLV